MRKNINSIARFAMALILVITGFSFLAEMRFAQFGICLTGAVVLTVLGIRKYKNKQ